MNDNYSFGSARAHAAVIIAMSDALAKLSRDIAAGIRAAFRQEPTKDDFPDRESTDKIRTKRPFNELYLIELGTMIIT